MRELPIIERAPMVRAIMDGRKTQTRRLVNFSLNYFHTAGNPVKLLGDWGLSRIIDFKDGILRYEVQIDVDDSRQEIVKPRYQIGCHLWVKETYAIDIPACPNGITYRSDHIDSRGDGPAHPIKWISPLFMPKKLARLWLEVKNVRCERLRDITKEDAIAEGAVFVDFGKDQWGNKLPGWKCGDRPTHCEECLGMARFAFGNAWNSIHGPDAWEENPWVFVYELRRIEK